MACGRWARWPDPNPNPLGLALALAPAPAPAPALAPVPALTLTQVADEGAAVLSVIVGEEASAEKAAERHFLGLHIHSSTVERTIERGTVYPLRGTRVAGAPRSSPRRAHVPHAGALFPGLSELPLDAPSRAYLKIEEALRWTGENRRNSLTRTRTLNPTRSLTPSLTLTLTR